MGRTRTLLPLAATALVAALGGQLAASQTDDPAIGRELAGIRTALERLASGEEADRRQRDVDLVIRRIELGIKRLEPIERQLSYAEAELRGEEDGLASLERMREQHEANLAEEIRQNVDAPRSETRRVLDDIERSAVGYETRIKAARQRIQQHENDLALGRKQIAILDERLMELLEER
jgi:hypothetical protein